MAALLRSIVFLLAALLLLALFGSALGFILKQLNLYPPQSLRIAAGEPGSAYHSAAIAYGEILARDGIELEISETAGSTENARLLADGTVDIALVQGGVALHQDARGIASIYLEPLWIFARKEATVERDPNRWQGLRVAAGAEGSGTRRVADALARYTGAESLGRDAASTAGGAEAAAGLLDGSLDIALFVAPANAPYLKPLLASDAVTLMTLAHGEAIAMRLAGAREVRLPSGILDYQRPFPDEDVEVVALVARLVAGADLHPALVNRLVHAAREVHGNQPIIPADRRYPSADGLGVPANDYAEQLLREGFSPLEGVLPYWIVAQVNRILLVLVPALLLLLPLLRLLPAVFQWVFQSRVFRHYTRVNEIDRRLAAADRGSAADDVTTLLRELDQIEARLRRTNLPNKYRKQAYTLLHHIDYVRKRHGPYRAAADEGWAASPERAPV